MNKRYLIAGALAAGTSVVWFTSSGWRSADIEFTRAALPAPAKVDLRADLSTVYVGVPVEIGPVAQRAEALIPARLAPILEWLPDAACAKRTQWVECNSAKMEGTITRTGPVEFQIDANAARLRIPFKYELSATGVGWANHLTEKKAGDYVLTVPFSIGVNPGTGLEVVSKEDPQAADASVTLLKATIKLPRLIDAKVRPAIKAAEDELRKALADVPVRPALHRAWAALNQPLELGQGSGLWLSATPEYFGNGGIVAVDGRMMYRIAIATRLTVAESERATTPTTRRTNPIPSQTPLVPGPTRVRMAAAVDLEAMRQSAEATFVKGEVIESRADRFTEPVKVRVRGTRIYPAQRQIGLELDLDVTTHKGVTHSGKAHLVGRPVLDRGDRNRDDCRCLVPAGVGQGRDRHQDAGRAAARHRAVRLEVRRRRQARRRAHAARGAAAGNPHAEPAARRRPDPVGAPDRGGAGVGRARPRRRLPAARSDRRAVVRLRWRRREDRGDPGLDGRREQGNGRSGQADLGVDHGQAEGATRAEANAAGEARRRAAQQEPGRALDTGRGSRLPLIEQIRGWPWLSSSPQSRPPARRSAPMPRRWQRSSTT